VIDLHCQVIPEVDDGPPTIEDALVLCDAARAAGTATIIATPHFNWDYPSVDAVLVHTGLARLNRELGAASIDIAVRPGAEMALSRLPDVSDAEIGVLRLGGGPNVLVECPHQAGAEVGIRDALRVFAKRGHGVVLGHPERSPTFSKHPRMLAALVNDGMLSCITVRALVGDYGSRVRSYAWEILAEGLVHVIASDPRRAPPAAGSAPDARARRARAGADRLLHRRAPAAIIAGEPVPAPPRIVAPEPRRRMPNRRLARRRTRT
jgi:protein-tyrosine phosphatase